MSVLQVATALAANLAAKALYPTSQDSECSSDASSLTEGPCLNLAQPKLSILTPLSSSLLGERFIL